MAIIVAISINVIIEIRINQIQKIITVRGWNISELAQNQELKREIAKIWANWIIFIIKK